MSGSPDRRPEVARELAQGDPAVLGDILVRFLSDETRKAGFERAVLGLSGGIDSSLAAALAVRALGAANVLGVLMPYGQSVAAAQAVADGELVARHLALPIERVDITALVDGHFAADPVATPLRRGNFMARMRMAVLFDRSMRDRALVIGTSNKSELLLGYGTLHGDLASALNPLGDLYKTQVRALSRHLSLPEAILRKPPSADLWPGQTDEGELGFTYEEVDLVLHLMVDRRLMPEEIADYGFTPEFITEVAKKIRTSQFKRRLPLIAKLSGRTVGLDFRYPRDWGI
jgi:NAD+ synthase